ncbi:branched-chain amino acid transaminase [candidate division KSB1 bacterium]|nr:branched-chain amino acid transaminase [candidate division KSB1 bacterium]
MKITAQDEQGKIWFDGQFIEWKDAKIHVMSHALHYGSSVFEGLRCYDTPHGSVIFRLKDHVRRLFDSAKVYRMEIPFSPETVFQACIDVVKINQMKAAYLRPLVFRGYGALGVDPAGCPTHVMIAVLNWGNYLGAEALTNGVDVCVSSWHRIGGNSVPAMAKAGSNYMNSQLIRLEAKVNGYAEGIGLDPQGHISEGSGENIFLIREGTVYTPPLGCGILQGLTRDCVIKIVQELGFPLMVTTIPREMVYLADEIFFTGSAAEVSPVRSVDRIVVGTGKRGPITEQIQTRLFDYINGKLEDKYHWLSSIY